MAATKKQKAGGLQSYQLTLPAGAVLPSGLKSALDNLEPTTPQESPAGISMEYPQLCRRLGDLGLKFQSAYNQRVAARIIDRSVRTLRAWSKQGKIACYRCNGIATTPSPFHTARSLENHLMQRERGEA